MAERQLITRANLEEVFLLHLRAEDHCEGVTGINIVGLEKPRENGDQWDVMNIRGERPGPSVTEGIRRVKRKFAGKFELNDR